MALVALVGHTKTAYSSHRATLYWHTAVQKQQRFTECVETETCVSFSSSYTLERVDAEESCLGILPQLLVPIPFHFRITSPIPMVKMWESEFLLQIQISRAHLLLLFLFTHSWCFCHVQEKHKFETNFKVNYVSARAQTLQAAITFGC